MEKGVYFATMPDGRKIDLADLPEPAPTAPAVNPLLIHRDEVIARCGISPEQLKALVKERVFPDRLPRSQMWNRKSLYRRLDDLKIRTTRVEPGYVYFMQMGEFIKIGWSTWPESRRAALQTSNPYDIIILGAYPGDKENEDALHRLFAHAQHRNEWFQKTPGLIAYMAWLKVAWKGDARAIRGELDNVVSLKEARG